MALETILASVILPAVVDLVKGAGGAISRKFIGLSVDDQIKLENAQVEKLKALADLDNPHGTPSQWVVDTRAIYRYAAATLVILIGGVLLFVETDKTLAYELVGMPFGFIFGERLWLGLKGMKSK